MDKPSNPQVFPWVKDGETPVTLRDLLAAAVLNGMGGIPWCCSQTTADEVARSAFLVADAVLREREEGRDDAD